MSEFHEVRPENAAVAIPFEFIHPPLSDENVQALSLPSSVEGEKRKLVHGWELSPDGLCTKKGEHNLEVTVLTSQAEINSVTSSPKTDFFELIHRVTNKNSIIGTANAFISILGGTALAGTIAYLSSGGNFEAAIGWGIGGTFISSFVYTNNDSYQDARIYFKSKDHAEAQIKLLKESSGYTVISSQELIGEVHIADYLADKLSKDPSPAELWQGAALPFLFTVREAQSKLNALRSDLFDINQVIHYVGKESKEDSLILSQLDSEIESVQKFISGQVEVLDNLCEKRQVQVKIEKSVEDIYTTDLDKMTPEGRRVYEIVLSAIGDSNGADKTVTQLVADTIRVAAVVGTPTQADAVLAKLKENYSSILK